MNSKLLILIGLGLGVIITASSLAGYQLIAQAERTDAEIQEQAMLAVQHNPVIVWDSVRDKVRGLVNFTENQLRHENQIIENAVVELEKRVSTLENRFLIIEATGKITVPPSATKANYELTCLSVTGQTVLSCEYAQDQIIYIRGQAPEHVGQFNWAIKKGGLIIASSQSSVPSNGQFIFVWNVSGNEQLTSYTAIVEINGKIDELAFNIK